MKLDTKQMMVNSIRLPNAHVDASADGASTNNPSQPVVGIMPASYETIHLAKLCSASELYCKFLLRLIYRMHNK